MNFFQQLAELSPNLDLTLRLMKKGDSITISVLPATVEKIQALTLTAPAAELDEKFIDAIRVPVKLISELDTTEYVKELQAKVDEARKEADEDFNKKDAKAGKTKPAKKTTPAATNDTDSGNKETESKENSTETEIKAPDVETSATIEAQATEPVVEAPIVKMPPKPGPPKPGAAPQLGL